ncbi:MAG: hypothetical protein IJ629_00165 [Clostridia bacterium]|nr:hypothetical protein [Clostridia bacterium]
MSENGKKVSSNKILSSLIPVIIFIVYTVITFIIWGDDKETGFWIGWVFGLIATGVTTAMPYLMVKSGKEVKSILDGFSVHFVTLCYFGAALVLGLLCMILNDNAVTLQIILQVILHAAYAFFMIASFMGKNIISGIEKEQKEKVYFVKSIAADLGLVAGKVQDPELKKKVEKIAEIARFSDPMSNQTLAGLEATISTKVEELKDAVADGKSIEEIGAIVDRIEEKFLERNEKCKLLK